MSLKRSLRALRSPEHHLINKQRVARGQCARCFHASQRKRAIEGHKGENDQGTRINAPNRGPTRHQRSTKISNELSMLQKGPPPSGDMTGPGSATGVYHAPPQAPTSSSGFLETPDRRHELRMGENSSAAREGPNAQGVGRPIRYEDRGNTPQDNTKIVRGVRDANAVEEPAEGDASVLGGSPANPGHHQAWLQRSGREDLRANHEYGADTTTKPSLIDQTQLRERSAPLLNAEKLKAARDTLKAAQEAVKQAREYALDANLIDEARVREKLALLLDEKRLRDLYKNDNTAKVILRAIGEGNEKLVQDLKMGPRANRASFADCSVDVNGTIRVFSKLYVPDALRAECVQAFYDLAGRKSQKGTRQVYAGRVYWPYIRQSVENFLKSRQREVLRGPESKLSEALSAVEFRQPKVDEDTAARKMLEPPHPLRLSGPGGATIAARNSKGVIVDQLRLHKQPASSRTMPQQAGLPHRVRQSSSNMLREMARGIYDRRLRGEGHDSVLASVQKQTLLNGTYFAGDGKKLMEKVESLLPAMNASTPLARQQTQAARA